MESANQPNEAIARRNERIEAALRAFWNKSPTQITDAG